MPLIGILNLQGCKYEKPDSESSSGHIYNDGKTYLDYKYKFESLYENPNNIKNLFNIISNIEIKRY